MLRKISLFLLLLMNCFFMTSCLNTCGGMPNTKHPAFEHPVFEFEYLYFEIEYLSIPDIHSYWHKIDLSITTKFNSYMLDCENGKRHYHAFCNGNGNFYFYDLYDFTKIMDAGFWIHFPQDIHFTEFGYFKITNKPSAESKKEKIQYGLLFHGEILSGKMKGKSVDYMLFLPEKREFQPFDIKTLLMNTGELTRICSDNRCYEWENGKWIQKQEK